MFQNGIGEVMVVQRKNTSLSWFIFNDQSNPNQIVLLISQIILWKIRKWFKKVIRKKIFLIETMFAEICF